MHTPSSGKLTGELQIWVPLCTILGVVVGSAVALFLWLLDLVTRLHWSHQWLLLLLPFTGLISGLLYHLRGSSSARGNDLIIDEMLAPGAGVPTAMAPLVLTGTLLTHIAGGSAGREGTAVQMGASLAAFQSRTMKLSPQRLRVMLSCGVASGFAAVFGTPLAGTFFALEMPGIGALRLSALIPCLTTAIIADLVTTAWGIRHTHYVITGGGGGSSILLQIALAGVCFGLAGRLFAVMSRLMHTLFARLIRIPLLRPCGGGVCIILMTLLVGHNHYLGLGVEANPATPDSVSIVSSFAQDGANPFSWLGKVIFTAVTVGSGFKGGEVTPLFYIGSTLGNALSGPLQLAPDLLAAIGFVAVFAAATNTPLACILMAFELFLPNSPDLAATGFLLHIAVGCSVAWLCSGPVGIYRAQRTFAGKWPDMQESQNLEDSSESSPESGR